MEMSSKENDPIESISKGATSAAIEWSEKKLATRIAKFKRRKLAFIGNLETIEIARAARKSSDWDQIKDYLDDKHLRVLFQVGLALRKLEKRQDRVEALRTDIIFSEHGPKGLHIAQMVQNGIPTRYLTTLLEKGFSKPRIKSEIKSLFENVERILTFVKEADRLELLTRRVVTRIHANSPETYIISSSGGARRRGDELKESVMREIEGYDVELYETPNRKIFFINKKYV